jgi:hypothetical protein
MLAALDALWWTLILACLLVMLATITAVRWIAWAGIAVVEGVLCRLRK